MSSPDLSRLSELFTRCSRAGRSAQNSASPIVCLREGDKKKTPLVTIHGVNGITKEFEELLPYLPHDRPVYAVRSQALLRQGRVLVTVEDMAAYYLGQYRLIEDRAPNLIGFSFGGLVALEMARQLVEQSQPVGMVALLDTRRMGSHRGLRVGAQRESVSEGSPIREVGLTRYHLLQLRRSGGLSYGIAKIRAKLLRVAYQSFAGRKTAIPWFLAKPYDINWFAAVRHTPKFYEGRIIVINAAVQKDSTAVMPDWSSLAGGGVDFHTIPSTHEELFVEPNVCTLAETIQACLARADRSGDVICCSSGTNRRRSGNVI